LKCTGNKRTWFLILSLFRRNMSMSAVELTGVALLISVSWFKCSVSIVFECYAQLSVTLCSNNYGCSFVMITVRTLELLLGQYFAMSLILLFQYLSLSLSLSLSFTHSSSSHSSVPTYTILCLIMCLTFLTFLICIQTHKIHEHVYVNAHIQICT